MNRKWMIPVIAAAFLCTACAFFPAEEELPEAPVLRVSEDEQYTQVAVLRGDLVAEEVVTCKYQPANEERLSFEISGEVISQVYVKQGDTVKAGDLLMELESTELHRQIEAQQETIDTLSLQVTQTEEKLNLYYERCALLDKAKAADPGYSSQSESADRTCRQLYDELEYLKKLLEVEQKAMDELQAKLSQRQLYASMDGTIRTVTTVNENEVKRSIADATVCIVSDLSSGNFMASANVGLFKVGDQVMIDYNGELHEATVSEILPDEKNEESEQVRFQLTIPDTTLDTTAVGKITVITDQREDVLYLPTSVVFTRNNVSRVYYLDENGVRCSKQVEIGLVTVGAVEIVSGVEEGELVIK